MIAVACDKAGFELARIIQAHLDEKGLAYKDFGIYTPESSDYPEEAYKAANAIADGECDRGILICGTGIGMSIAANKVPGIRAALCTTVFMAEMARDHNDANILCLGARVIDAAQAILLVDTFLTHDFSGEQRHSRRVNMLNNPDKFISEV